MSLPFNLYQGDCIEVMRTMEGDSVDAIVCDPPYGLSAEPDMAEVLRHWLAGDDYQHKGGGFMGKTWDSFVPGPAIWREALRVLKPGGHLLAFFGSRTYDMGTLALRLAGFEVRDQIMWVYGSGFPKSLDVSKAIDKARDDSEDGKAVGVWLKAQREARGFKQKDVAALWPSAAGGLTGCVANWETLGKVPKWDQWQALKAFIGFGDDMDAEVWRLNGRKGTPGNEREILEERPASGIGHNGAIYGGHAEGATQKIDAGPATDAARQWSGWGTALKPAHEPICVARKPLVGTVAANVLAHGTGALNIDGCRVGTESTVRHCNAGTGNRENWRTGNEAGTHGSDAGRWPANLIHDGSDEVVALFPDAKGQQGAITGDEPSAKTKNAFGEFDRRSASEPRREEDRSAARFFYCAKASRADRNAGLPDPGPQLKRGTTLREVEKADDAGDLKGNTHPTVKPTDLMAYLCRLVTPPGGVVLDPFMGSGSTGKAAMREGFRFIGIELDAGYMEIATARIEHELARVTAAKDAPPEPQMDLFTGNSKEVA